MKYSIHVEDVTDSETVDLPDKAVGVRLEYRGDGMQVLSYLAPVKRAAKKRAAKKPAKKVTKSAGVKKAPAKKK